MKFKMACGYGCSDEGQQLDHVSPGPIGDPETLCRGAFGKGAHYNNAGVKPTFVRDRDLLAGELSVWRLHDGTEAEFEDIRIQLHSSPPPNNALWDVFGATAGEIRGIRVLANPDVQVLHAYDDCSVNSSDEKHPKHATLRICETLNPSDLNKDEPTYVEIRDALVKIFRQNVLWSLPASERT